MTRNNVEDLLPILTRPLFALVFMAVLIHAGRSDLGGYALVAPLLLTVGQMAFFVASELISNERAGQTLELVVVTPTPYAVVLFPRIVVLAVLSLVGFVESWLIIRLAFDVNLTIHHPWLLAATMVLTAFAAAGTALIAAALFSLSRNVRTVQTSVTYPIYVLAGVLVPVGYLPDWIEPMSRIIFLYWAANLLRDSMQVAEPADVVGRLGIIFALAVGSTLLGAMMVRRMIEHLRQEGTLGF